ncbi:MULTISPECIES: ATP-binding protein [Pseudothermotoga]|jgi:serine/threonine-protein kinase RsbW|uniref:Putative anti-sigma regulatory factor, serine/threonine protein kinase n=1 Tax=Pseudothermotoga lettingae (strain ATCC BAA-301 / DSM 14385 / NBRC 107922 / TMO) TaxID=416591 RepID=A8F517_PSELT|nr:MULTISPECIES: ATP-binding protein [Pseudothermotoga]ABV33251.1 putative anti-sigma regulatory factor, serine/threonine protein kinase [Pseudothermotoga lettingae TMO]KUK20728.1 MAG: Putative anti-sigma regulatory factor, serine/threonine protein kinase [Pseudothermotoga lettingae]MDI3493897.1 serine/threonine-protein kinase RsbW [Pseudothermotoga sp.]MDK2884577.1 serine/threonine-protein kinase RsbW [Pseudothermotoga sp.]GLI49832.1 serine/threonine protein kinase [Pseudothermotoga lettingae
MRETLTISFSSKTINTRVARAVIRSFLSHKGIFDEEIWDTELGVNEAITNIIRHTYKGDQTKYIIMTLVWDYTQRKIEIMLRDFGDQVDPEIIKPKTPSSDKEGGFGLYLINRIFDSVKLKNRDNGNLLILTKTYAQSGDEN